ncbi:hypothetical protein Y032_0370g93 [Ancylostoma ceylanicum]|uniref:Uncharacterized protein n=1 Tax=Ancylostoma ceylanicum TaxID=53326 RepID=A0A016RUH1_9BILA|nr:hypothetical protein Y032_0370g93 [Ancylostoma ceylanicum]
MGTSTLSTDSLLICDGFLIAPLLTLQRSHPPLCGSWTSYGTHFSAVGYVFTREIKNLCETLKKAISPKRVSLIKICNNLKLAQRNKPNNSHHAEVQ